MEETRSPRSAHFEIFCLAPVFTDFKEGISFGFRVVYLDSSPLLWMDAQEFGVQSSHQHPHAESKEDPLHCATDEMWHPMQLVPIWCLAPASVPCAPVHRPPFYS